MSQDDIMDCLAEQLHILEEVSDSYVATRWEMSRADFGRLERHVQATMRMVPAEKPCNAFGGVPIVITDDAAEPRLIVQPTAP